MKYVGTIVAPVRVVERKKAIGNVRPKQSRKYPTTLFGHRGE